MMDGDWPLQPSPGVGVVQPVAVAPIGSLVKLRPKIKAPLLETFCQATNGLDVFIWASLLETNAAVQLAKVLQYADDGPPSAASKKGWVLKQPVVTPPPQGTKF